MSAAHTEHTTEDMGPLQLSRDGASRLMVGAGVLALAGLIATIGAMFSEGLREQALNSYLVAYFYVMTLALGGLWFVILQHLCNAIWSTTVRRVAEAVGATIPGLALLFLPIAIGATTLFGWAGREAHDPSVVAKAGYLNLPFFYARAVFYLALWGGLGAWYHRRSVALDHSGDPFILLGLRKLSAPAMLFWALSITFAGFDWMMAGDPEWYSTIFGVYIFAGTAVSSLALLMLVGLFLRRAGYLERAFTVEHYHDLAKLAFGFIVFWTYVGFSQYFLQWYSNIPEETRWFGNRWVGSWQGWSVALIFGNFAIPFFAILSRNAKRSLPILWVVSIWLLVFHYVDIYWLVMPNSHKDGVAVSWLDLSALIGVGGAFVALLAWRLGSAPLVPVKDPYLADSVEFENV